MRMTAPVSTGRKRGDLILFRFTEGGLEILAAIKDAFNDDVVGHRGGALC
jgi:hypothetical protein